MWIAKDKGETNPSLYLVKPVRDEENGIWHTNDWEWPESQSMPLGKNFIQEISWEDEPIRMNLARADQKLSRELIEDIVVCIYSWEDISSDWIKQYGLPIPISDVEYLYDRINGNINRWLKSNGWKTYIIEDYVSWKIKTNTEVAYWYKKNCESFKDLKSEGNPNVLGVSRYFDVDSFDEDRKDSVYKNFG